MVKLIVKKSQLSGNISCPPSKSYSHRAIVISALSNGISNLENVLFSRDTIATIKCCKMLGTEIEANPSTKIEQSNNIKDLSLNTIGNLKISSNGGRIGFDTPNDILNAENSGTTIRLLASVCSLVNRGYTILSGDNSLRKRPMGDLINSLNQLGVECFSSKISNTPPLIVKGGGMKGGESHINGQISSQFISSLLLSGIYAKTKVTIKVLGDQVSKPYIDSTISIMKKFGIEIKNHLINNNNKIDYNESLFDSSIPSDTFFNLHPTIDTAAATIINADKQSNIVTESYEIPNETEYLATKFRVPGDFSTAALLLSAAILSDGEVTISNLDFSLPQGDSNIINILKKMGANIFEDKNKGTVRVIGTEMLDGGEFNLKDTPDLLPVVSILSLKGKNPIKITGISHARYKETDRVANIASQLVKFGAEVKEDFDSIFINPPKRIKNASINSFDDHRLFMAFFIASLATEESTIDGVESVDVSYPGFIDDLKKIGARIET
ncbi:MAG: 3-phosphoshikimate 1-carboxyvinyltransferase [Thermoproteota archaeon]|nr:3-phosphoshikimate 1-carboxyvinyltransferase [Thermoproteota archaeon]